MGDEEKEDLKKWFDERITGFEKTQSEIHLKQAQMHEIVVGGIRNGQVYRGLATRTDDIEAELSKLREQEENRKQNNLVASGTTGGVIAGAVVAVKHFLGGGG